MEEIINKGFESKSRISIYNLSKKALEVLIDKGIVDYVTNRSKDICKVVLYGENANFLKKEIIGKSDIHCEIGHDVKEQGVINNVWHLDVDDLVDLYSRGSFNY